MAKAEGEEGGGELMPEENRTPTQQVIADAVHRMAPVAQQLNLAIGQAVITTAIELNREFARLLAQERR